MTKEKTILLQIQRRYIVNEKGALQLSEYAEYTKDKKVVCYVSYDIDSESISEIMLGNYFKKNEDVIHYKSGNYNHTHTCRYNNDGSLKEEIFTDYDKERTVTKYYYNSKNQLIRVYKENANKECVSDTTYRYDENDNCIFQEITDILGNKKISSSYNNSNQKIKEIVTTDNGEDTEDRFYTTVTEFFYSNGTLVESILKSSHFNIYKGYNEKGHEIYYNIFYTYKTSDNIIQTCEYIYDERGNIVDEKIWKNNILNRRLTRTFNTNNDIVEIVFHDEKEITHIEKWEYIYEEEEKIRNPPIFLHF
ncbi:hypothetical protein [Riemerella anatipestifer]|uniref:hypothetical protein n=1 Tax=Riemerella anatipestifer TaxID=34085 RepID=UPI0006998C5F|nr:hypothetical protein [Riemerella anatipestifer]